MRFRDFVSDKKIAIMMAGIFILFELIFIYEITGNGYASFFLTSFFVLAYSVGLLVEYFVKRKYYREIKKDLNALEEKTLILELIPPCHFKEGQVVVEILQECLKYMNDELAVNRRVNREFREYIESWIHEVKTPIASAKLQVENGREEGDVREDLECIEGYVEQALYYARSNSVEKDYIVTECNLEELVNDSVRKNRKYFIQNGVRIEKESLDQVVYTDPKWVHFILWQIMGNSIKYRGREPVIRVCGREEKTKVVLMIEDNGIGISGEDLPRVCEKGYTGTTGRRMEKATGMGLYLCRKLCGKLNLGLVIQSKEDQGTKVFITFPKTELSFIKADLEEK